MQVQWVCSRVENSAMLHIIIKVINSINNNNITLHWTKWCFSPFQAQLLGHREGGACSSEQWGGSRCLFHRIAQTGCWCVTSSRSCRSICSMKPSTPTMPPYVYRCVVNRSFWVPRDGAGGAFLCACTGVWLTGFECGGVGWGGGISLCICCCACTGVWLAGNFACSRVWLVVEGGSLMWKREALLCACVARHVHVCCYNINNQQVILHAAGCGWW